MATTFTRANRTTCFFVKTAIRLSLLGACLEVTLEILSLLIGDQDLASPAEVTISSPAVSQAVAEIVRRSWIACRHRMHSGSSCGPPLLLRPPPCVPRFLSSLSFFLSPSRVATGDEGVESLLGLTTAPLLALFNKSPGMTLATWVRDLFSTLCASLSPCRLQRRLFACSSLRVSVSRQFMPVIVRESKCDGVERKEQQLLIVRRRCWRLCCS